MDLLRRFQFWPERRPSLRPYARPPITDWRRHLNWLYLGAFSAFCFVYGFGFALTAPYLVVPFAVPVMILVAASIWALPGLRTAPTRTMEALFFAYCAALIMWPNYLAIALPGLPWMTALRLTGIPLSLCLLVALSVSAEFRSSLFATINTTSAIWKLLAMLVAIQFVTIGFSQYPGQSASKFFVAQLNNTAIFFVACYVFAKPGRMFRWASLFWFMAVFIALLVTWEYAEKRVLWNGHVPSFLKIEEAAGRLEGSVRGATGAYRAKGPFSTALGLGEFIALTLPFVLHFAFGRFDPKLRIAAALSVPLLIYSVTTSDSRLGAVGALLSVLIYFFFWSFLKWRREKTGLFGPAIVFSYPVLFSAAVAATMVITPLRRKVWGGGAQQASNQGRISQFEDGVPLILKQPWGHGIGQGAETLDHRGRGGVLTIDSYYLSAGLEYGVIGFMIFYALVMAGIWYAGRNAFRSVGSPNLELTFFVPLAVSITNFFVIRAVFSQTDMFPLFFMMLGMVVGLMTQMRRQDEAPGAAGTALAPVPAR